MEFALTLEVSQDIIDNGISDVITNVSDKIAFFLLTKSYGDGLKTIHIGIICVSPQFDFLLKQRKPKYKRGKRKIIQDNRIYEQSDIIIYDIKLDYQKFLNATDKEAEQNLIAEILKSFVSFNNFKILDFDKEKFELDIANFVLTIC